MRWRYRRPVAWELRSGLGQPQIAEAAVLAGPAAAGHIEDILRLLWLASFVRIWMGRRKLTIALVVSLAEATTVPLVILVEALLLPLRRLLLLAVLRIVALLVILLLILRRRSSSIGLAWLERLGAGLERCDGWAEAPLRLGRVQGVHVELLLRLSREVLILSSRVVLPRVEVGHAVGWDVETESCRFRESVDVASAGSLVVTLQQPDVVGESRRENVPRRLVGTAILGQQNEVSDVQA